MHRIAIITPDILHQRGLQSIIEEFFPRIEACCYNEVADIGCDDFILYIVDSETFASEQEFSIPRRQRTLTIQNSGNSVSPKLIRTGYPLEQTVDTITAMMNELESTNQSMTTTEELSTREIQVLQLVVSGAINKEVAQSLNISLNTVLTHRKNITAKLGIKTVSGLTLYALMHGYITNK